MLQLLKPLRILSPAKLNFFLNVLEKRDDNYHELFLDFVPINLYDEILIRPSKSFEFKTNKNTIQNDQNLIVKAVEALEKEIGEKIILSIALKKNIPMGAGLGGGSSNAGRILDVLNDALELKIQKARLIEIACDLGADVPFFLDPSISHARGVGEKLSPLSIKPDLHIAVVFPNFSISTKEAYQGVFLKQAPLEITDYSIDELSKVNVESNHFWKHLSILYPKLIETKGTLDKSGSIFSGLSGSGSTVFGVFKDESDLEKAKEFLEENLPEMNIYYCQVLNKI